MALEVASYPSPKGRGGGGDDVKCQQSAVFWICTARGAIYGCCGANIIECICNTEMCAYLNSDFVFCILSSGGGNLAQD